MAERDRFLLAIGLAILLHALLLNATLPSFFSAKHLPSLPTLDVDLSSLPLPAPAPASKAVPAPPKTDAHAPQQAPPQVPLPNRQIVQPPDAGEEKEPANTNLLSDKNNTVPQEQVRRGDQGADENATESRLSHKSGGTDAKQPPQLAPAHAPPAEKPKAVARPAPPAPKEHSRSTATEREPGDDATRLASLPSLDKLLPNAAEVAQQEPLPRETPQARSGRDLLNSGGEVFAARPGTRDYLPHVREGNVTMLNTKADLFAPFVRRVAGRVFENLDLSLSSLRARHNVGAGRALVTVEAVMDRRGHFVSANVLENSGNTSAGMDRMLLAAATPDTFFDANPPSGAEASDGNIHFMLLVDLTVEPMADPRTGREFVNYFGIAGVGLK